MVVVVLSDASCMEGELLGTSPYHHLSTTETFLWQKLFSSDRKVQCQYSNNNYNKDLHFMEYYNLQYITYENLWQCSGHYVMTETA